MNDRKQEFTDYFASRSGALRGTAYLLCGDWHRAQDLVQTTFVKLYRAWDRVAARDCIDAYTRRILVREKPTAQHAETIAPGAGSPEDRLVLLHALRSVPPRQRAALVLRFWEDLSVEDTARAPGLRGGDREEPDRPRARRPARRRAGDPLHQLTCRGRVP
jgi:DNA-directed RNA polymerase specialized sigma24 family protein